ncbi:hypothetical protein SOVF_093490 isoform B [Spinacia oleracea]|uniref:Uncharacterized protein isoform X2 n=1 Tax=Spinacia oleracea TaxID=3562 RepID=A0A9R0IML0_SPIOL|nr:uncharacterized protein LOC110791681 isoform X2 [Spinacia oleracea]KNA15969.1 hypothetical protein SOVF_093490 isoform B [Spinacia oleracea]
MTMQRGEGWCFVVAGQRGEDCGRAGLQDGNIRILLKVDSIMQGRSYPYHDSACTCKGMPGFHFKPPWLIFFITMPPHYISHSTKIEVQDLFLLGCLLDSRTNNNHSPMSQLQTRFQARQLQRGNPSSTASGHADGWNPQLPSL